MFPVISVDAREKTGELDCAWDLIALFPAASMLCIEDFVVIVLDELELDPEEEEDVDDSEELSSEEDESSDEETD